MLTQSGVDVDQDFYAIADRQKACRLTRTDRPGQLRHVCAQLELQY